MKTPAKDIVDLLNRNRPPIEATISTGPGPKWLIVHSTPANSSSVLPIYKKYPISKDGTIPDSAVSMIKSRYKIK